MLIEGAGPCIKLAAHARLALLLTVGLMALASVGTWVLNSFVVSVYGPEYEEAADILPLLMLASVPWALTSITLAELRVRGSHVGTALVTGVFAAGVLLPALVLVPDDGLDGAVTTWLIGNLAAAVLGGIAARVTPPQAGAESGRIGWRREEELGPPDRPPAGTGAESISVPPSRERSDPHDRDPAARRHHRGPRCHRQGPG